MKSCPFSTPTASSALSRPDIAEIIRKLWVAHHDQTEVRLLLLQLILLGNLKDCADIAADAAFGAYQDRDTMILSGRALAATGDDATKQRYANFIQAECAALPNILTWNAVEEPFPRS